MEPENKVRILFLMPSLKGGGAERALINLLNAMDYERYTVDLVVVANRGIFLDQVPPSVALIPLFGSELLVRILALLQRKFGLVFPFRWRIRSKVTANYDLGISFQDSIFTDLLFYLPNLRRRVSWVHGSYLSNEKFGRFFRTESNRQRLKKRRYDRLDQLVFVSNHARAEFENLFGVCSSAQVLRNLATPTEIHEKANAFMPKKPDGFCFFAMGRLQPIKGFDRLLRSLHLLIQRGDSCYLLLAGEGPERNNLEKLIYKFRLQERVTLLGFQPNPYPYLQSSDAFVLSSVSEGLPSVISEALILGKPIVATDCGGARELLGNHVGLLSRQDDEDLARQMRRLLMEADLRQQLAARAKIRGQLFDDDKALAAYCRLFDANH